MASKETDEFTTHPTSFIEGAGTSLKAAMDAARNYGVVTDKVLPFHVACLLYTSPSHQTLLDLACRLLLEKKTT